METPKLKDIADLIHRRLNDSLERDLVNLIYATIESDGKVLLTFILGDSPNENRLISIAVRYNHAIEDLHKNFKVKVIPKDAYFKPRENSFIIYDYHCGGYVIKIPYGR